MSMLSGLSSYIDKEGELLYTLNDSVLSIQAAILGDLELLGISQEKFNNASSNLINFLEKLEKALKEPSDDPTISMLIENIRCESEKSVREWDSSLQELIDAIENNRLDENPELLQIIEDILNLLNADYSEAVKALYYRYR